MELPNRRSNDFILDILSLSRVPVFTSLVRLAATLVARSSIANTIIPGARKSKLVKASVPGMCSYIKEYECVKFGVHIFLHCKVW